jgi:hypothetical protein
MKNIKITYLLLAALAFVFNACQEEELATLKSSASLNVTVSATSVVLTEDGEGTDVLTVSWPKPDYGFSASPDNVIYLSITDDFSGALAIPVGGALSKTFKSEDLNSRLITLGVEPNVATPIKVKVESKLGTFKSITSEVKTVSATAYSAVLNLVTTWGVVGSGYNNWGAFPDAPFFKTKIQDELVCYVRLVTGEIKFRENNAWDNNVGDNGLDGTTESGGANIPVTAGDYKIVFNPVANTYSITAYSWGIVGSAYNDWGATPDFNFTYDDATDQWRAIVKLKDGEFKIRKNSDWGLNYGDDGADGTLQVNGANIAVTAGKYVVTFNENELTVEIEPIEFIWGLVGSSYNNWGATADAPFVRDWHFDGIWVLKSIPLLAGEFKVRDDNSWALNYGDNGGDLTLDKDGSNITSEAGVYTITLDFSDPANPKYTKTKH